MEKISCNSHLAILDEIIVRDIIELDPTINYVLTFHYESKSKREEEDNKSISKEENEEEEE